MNPRSDDDRPVTLAPLTPEEALRALLAVRPEDQSSDAEAREEALSDDESSHNEEAKGANPRDMCLSTRPKSCTAYASRLLSYTSPQPL